MRSLGIATCTLFFALHVRALIPMKCLKNYDRQNPGECCPDLVVDGQSMGECGSKAGRGECVSVSQRCNTKYTDSVVNEQQETECGQNLTDKRLNWPSRLFSHVCKCEGNYGDYDCGGCAYGYINNSNSECEMDPHYRRSVTSLSDQEWDDYLKLLQLAKDTVSTRYAVLTDEEPYHTNTTTYNLFIWLHHYATKDHLDHYNETNTACDYAHESTGFLTWHRILLLWLERELQILNETDTFRISYWDWTNEEERATMHERLFTDERLGSSNSDSPEVTGDYFDSSKWETICLGKKFMICDPRNITGSLKRCLNDTFCESKFPEWPSRKDLKSARNMASFEDPQKHNKYAENSFANFVEGYDRQDDSCGTTTLCNCDRQSRGEVKFARKLHNSVHILLGVNGSIGGDDCSMKKGTDEDEEEEGAMGDVRASPNDPVFIHHHAMIDLIFERWLMDHKSASYGGPPSNSQFPGHAAGDCAVPFMPVFTHSEAFKTADNFGYVYEGIDEIFDSTTPSTTTAATTDHTNPSSRAMVSVPMIVTGILLALITILA